MFTFKFKKMALVVALALPAFVIASSVQAAAAYVVINAAANAQKPVKTKPVDVKAKKVEKKTEAKKSPVKKDDGKIKPLDPNRKVPTLKKKYKKD